MKKVVLAILFLLVSIFFFSCEKELNIHLNAEDNAIVVQGQIETNQLPFVSITKSIGFFDKIDLNSVVYVKNANVSITDITTNSTIQLKEYTLDTLIDNKTYSFTVYAPDFNDPVALNFKGEIEHTYLLTINYNGKSHLGVTKIPAMTGLDSLWVEPVPGKENEFSVLKALYNDPDSLGNAICYETKNNQYKKDSTSPEMFYKPINYAYDDAVVNGGKLPLTLDLGYDKYKSNIDFQNLGFMKKGDTVTVKWSAIDHNVFNFWSTLSFSANSVGNPFATPTKVQGNVSGAIGVWAGYNTTFYTIIDSL